MANFEITLTGTEVTSIYLSIRNTGTSCHMLQSNKLILEGGCPIGPSFFITDSEASEVLPYRGIFASVIPMYLKLDPDEEVTSKEIDLSSSYNFEQGKSYDIHYNIYLVYHDCDSEQNYGSTGVSSNHIEIWY